MQKTEKSTYGTIFNIDRYGIHDGPGIRTIVFLKGCSIYCQWCCNPEGQKPQIEVIKFTNRCIDCGICFSVCENGAIKKIKNKFLFDSDVCTACMKCVNDCPSNSMTYYGKVVSSDEILSLCKKDKNYYDRSGGGITLSGGEPAMQSDFSSQILALCKANGINTAVETCGYVPWKDLIKILDHTDYVLFDIKSMDSAKHKKMTGVGNELILENLKKISKKGNKIFLRMPLIPHFNDSLKDLRQSVEFVQSINGNMIELNLLPYHEYGAYKYKYMGLDYKLKGLHTRPASYYIKLKKEFDNSGIKVKIGG